ncbi:cytochrome P450 [Trametes elegans]|nr:cytochrome P450 [Trametes elegans]
MYAFEASTSVQHYACVALLVAFLYLRWITDPLRHIPTVGGPSLPLLSYLGALRFLGRGKQFMEEGYRKYCGSVFKVAMFDRWLVVLTGPRLIEYVKNCTDEELSTDLGLEAFIQSKFYLSHILEDPYHVLVTRDRLTRSLHTMLPDIMDELESAIQAYLPTNANDWQDVDVMNKIRMIIARVSNRIIVGPEACRNEEFLSIAVGITTDMTRDRRLINLFPEYLKPLVGRLVSRYNAKTHSLQRAIVILNPIIDKRRRCMEKYGDEWAGKPEDMLQWFIDVAVRKGYTNEQIVQRVFVTEFASIHVSSLTTVHELYALAERPDYQTILREEIEPIVEEEGWTKASVAKMWRLDSIMKESQRYTGVTLVSLMRVVMKDLTLPGGTYIPSGTLMVAEQYHYMHDNAVYDNAELFDPWRFSRPRETEGESARYQCATPSVDFIPFGIGKHACPGRWFAVNELKMLVGHVLLKYDIKIDGDGKRPAPVYFAHTISAPEDRRILFRNRQVATD